MNRIVLCLIVSGMSVCACSSVHRTYTADGRLAYLVSCRGLMKRWSDCITRAGRRCGARGYQVRYEEELDRELLIVCERARRATASALE